MKNKRIFTLFLAFTMILSVLTGTTFGASDNRGILLNEGKIAQATEAAIQEVEPVDDEPSTDDVAYVRIEGDTDTFIPKTEVPLVPLDLSEYGASKEIDEVSVIEVLLSALEISGLDAKDSDVIEHGGGSYISSVCGLEAGAMSGWMYTLNGKAPQWGVNQQAVKDQDEIVLYFIEDWTLSGYAYFDIEEKVVDSGEAFELTLLTDVMDMNTWETNTQPCADAEILVDGNVVGTTDADGKITLTFEEEDTYYVSARKYSDYDVNMISRPYCEVRVNGVPEEVLGTTEDLNKLQILSIDEHNKEYTADVTLNAGVYSYDIPVEGTCITGIKVVGENLPSKLAIGEINAVDGSFEVDYKISDSPQVKLTVQDGKKKEINYNLVFSQAETKSPFDYRKAINTSQQWIQNNVDFSTTDYKVGSTPDWNVLALSRSGIQVPSTYFEKMEEMVASYGGSEQFKAAMTKVTEYERMAIGITASGNDATDVAGVDFIEGIYNNQRLTNQGMNGPIYGLLAIDSHQYKVPSDALYTREKIIDILLENQLQDGGWGFSTSKSDIDLTAMALQALAPYTKNNNFEKQKEVQAAVEKALDYLSSMQEQNGMYKAYGNYNPESMSQVIVALSTLGIDCKEDERFIKNGNTLIDALEGFYNEADGGFKHVLTGKTNAMATQQTLYGLTAYERFLNSENTLYDMTDIVFETKKEIHIDLEDQAEIILNQKQEKVELTTTEEFKEANLDITEVASNMPSVIISLKEHTINVPKGISVNTNNKKLEVKNVIAQSLDAYKTQFMDIKDIESALKFGNESEVQFSDFVTITFKGKENLEAGFIDNEGKVHKIEKNPSSVQNLQEYAITNGKDLMIKTKHLTTFFVYSKTTPQDSNSSNTEEKITVSISVDAKTINKGYFVNTKQISLKEGATAFDALNTLGLNLVTTGSGKDIYVAGINGLGEFDHGSLSGWMYNVNGKYPNVGLGSYTLSEGDVVEVRYTTNGGKDLGDSASALIGGGAGAGSGSGGQGAGAGESYTEMINEVVKVLEKRDLLSEWELIGLAHKIQLSNTVKTQLINKVKAEKGEYRKVTDLERMIIALGAAGFDAQDIEGLNLVEKLYNRDSVEVQGSNGVIFALIALDSRQYEVPKNSKWTREKLVQTLLQYQNKDGGFALSKDETSNVDITAMALSALAPYKDTYKTNIENALTYLSKVQSVEGEFSYEGNASSESTAQVIIALSTLGIDVKTDSRFIKNNTNLLQILTKYYVDKQGFKHEMSGTANQMATEQALLALLSYEKFVQKANGIYSFEKVATSEVEKETSLQQFKDSHKISSWAVESVETAVNRGIIQGSDGQLNPKDKVTRAEFVTMLLNVLGEKTNAISESEFKDIDINAWYSNAVHSAYHLNLVQGMSDKYFMPNACITREQMAVILNRLIAEESQSEVSSVVPVDFDTVASWAKPGVLVMYNNELMKGDQGKFAPKQEVTREMAIVILMRYSQMQQ